MRLFSISLLLCTCFLGLTAQVAQKVSYQAVIRDAEQHLIRNKTIGMRITLLQGSPVGITVYEEIQAPASNSNGLVTMEIGGGPGFDTINWGHGPYYIRLETDLLGGINYTLTSVHQLLSVPYALYAGTAERLKDQDMKHYIGELYGGGVVFYVDHTGEHGLVCAMTDQDTLVTWSNILTTGIGAAAQSFWDGASNSPAIVNQPGHIRSAAQVCLDYVNEDYGTGIFSDWYLPAVDECKLIDQTIWYIDKAVALAAYPGTRPLNSMYYWSSTENDEHAAWMYSMRYSTCGIPSKAQPCFVRAVRAF